MPANKTSIYDGCVYLDANVDSLNLTGDINRKPNADTARGVKTVTFNALMTTVLSPGDQLMKSSTNEYIGKVKSIATNDVTFEKGINIALTDDDYVHVYPKFEIVRIDVFGLETYIYELTPVNTKSIGNKSPDHGTWASKTINDFGSQENGGASFNLGSLLGGTSIEGRWKRVVIDKTGTDDFEHVMCYLKATPTIM